MPSLALSIVFASALLLTVLLKFWLATRQMRHVARHRDAVPAAFANTVSLQAHQKAADYTLARLRFGLLSLAFGTAVVLGWTLLGGLDALNGTVRDALLPRWGGLVYQLGLLAAGDDVRARLGAIARRGVEEHYSFARWAATWRSTVLG